MAIPEPSNFFDAPGLAMDPGRAAVENAIVGGRQALAVSVDSVSLLARFSVLRTQSPHCAAWIDLRSPQGKLRVLLDSVDFLPTVRSLLLDAPLPESLPPDLAAAVAETILATLPGSAGLSLESAGVGSAPGAFLSDGWKFDVRIENGEGGLLAGGMLYCEEGVAKTLAETLEASPAGSPSLLVEPDAIGRVQLASIQITVEDFEQLQPLDVLVLGAYGLGGRIPVRLFFASGLHFFGSLDGEVITMNDQEKSGEPNQEPAPAQSAPADLDKLPVRIGLELGSITVTLAELKAMAAGSIIEIPAPLDSPVTLRANGREIGHGALLRVGDHMAVRILDFGAQSSPRGQKA